MVLSFVLEASFLADKILILFSGILRWSQFCDPEVGVTSPGASFTCSPFTGILQHHGQDVLAMAVAAAGVTSPGAAYGCSPLNSFNFTFLEFSAFLDRTEL